VTVTEQEQGEARAKRSDAGTVRLTPRDYAALIWLEDMRVIQEPDLAVLLTRISGRERVLSDDAARAVVNRWAKLRLARRSRLLVSTPPYVWLTQHGALLASGAEVTQWTEPRWPTMPHAAAVSRARLWLEAHPDPALHATGWVSERAWRREHGFGRNQAVLIPDGEFSNGYGTRVAAEVELSAKGPKRSVEKVRRLATGFEAVLFLVPEGSQAARTVRTAILEASEQAGDDIARRVRVEELPGRLES
jgi:hypothetical protein